MLSSPQFPRISTPLFYIQSNSSATCSHVARVNSKNRLCCSWRRLLERVDNRRIIYSGLSWCETCFYMMHSSRHKRFTFLERTTGAENITLWYSAQCSMYRFWYTKLCHACALILLLNLKTCSDSWSNFFFTMWLLWTDNGHKAPEWDWEGRGSVVISVWLYKGINIRTRRGIVNPAATAAVLRGGWQRLPDQCPYWVFIL